jgi:hypothetical protein
LAGYHEFLALPTDACQDWELGDLDNSGNVDIIDILILSDQLISGFPTGTCPGSVADVNQDGTINVMDVIYLVSQILNP